MAKERKEAFQTRRDALKTLATVHWQWLTVYIKDKRTLETSGGRYVPFEEKPFRRLLSMEKDTDRIIGYGIREKLMHALGFSLPTGEDLKNIENDSNTRYKDFMEQDDLNVEVTAVAIFSTSMLKKQ